MAQEDVARQHEFDQDLELYGLDSARPRVAPLERARAFVEARTRPDEDAAPFAIEADGRYVGYCGLMRLGNRYGNAELGMHDRRPRLLGTPATGARSSDCCSATGSTTSACAASR